MCWNEKENRISKFLSIFCSIVRHAVSDRALLRTSFQTAF